MKGRFGRRWALLVAALAVVAVGGGLLLLSPSSSSGKANAAAVARASITIDGVEVASFQVLTSIVQEVEAPEYVDDGTDPDPGTSKTLGKAKTSLVTLSRAFDGNLFLSAWHQAVQSGDAAAARRSVTLTLYNATGVIIAKYFLDQAWLSKLAVTSEVVNDKPVLVETAVFAADAIQRLAP